MNTITVWDYITNGFDWSKEVDFDLVYLSIGEQYKMGDGGLNGY